MSTLMSQNDRCIESIVGSLCARLGGGLDVATISAEVEAAFAEFSTARVTQFVPILVERRVWARLSEPRSVDHHHEEEMS